MVQREPDVLALLRQVSLFYTLDEAELYHATTILKEQRFRKGDVIFQQGEPGLCLYIIGSGRVRVYISSADGREVTLRIYGAGNHFGEFSVLDGAPRAASISAISNVTAYVLYRDDLLHLLEMSKNFMYQFLTTLTERLRYTTTYSENLAFLSIPQRVAAILTQLAEFEDTSLDPIRLDLTQNELAGLVCATRESVNYALRALADQQLLRIERGAVVVLNRAALREASGTI